MPSPPKRSLPGVSKEIVEGIPSAGTFEGIPKVRKVAGASATQSVVLLPSRMLAKLTIR